MRRLRRSERRIARVAGIRFSIISALIILPFSFTANSILLSTITDRGIQGAEPRLHRDLEAEIAAEAFNRFGFTYNDVNYDDNNISSFPLIAASTKVSAFKSQLKSTFKDTLIGNDATDANGDGNFKLVGIDDSDEVLAPQALSIKIRDGNNVDIADLATTKDKTFCELSLSNPGPYKIEISNNLRLTTEYGDPRKKDYTATTTETSLKQPSKQYSIDVAGLCNLKPAEMTKYTTDVSIPGGYNAAKFDPINGFKVDSGFPRTGFAGASFSLIGSGNNQNLYRCKSDNAGTDADKEILLSGTSSQALGENCTVTYKTDADHQVRPTRDITIVMQVRSTVSSSDWSDIDSFIIKKDQIKKWAIRMGPMLYGNALSVSGSTNFPVLNACRKVGPYKDGGVTTTAQATNLSDAGKEWRQQYLYRRNELTNSPYADPDIYKENTSPATGGYFSRDTDEEKSTFMGEWGYVSKYWGFGGTGGHHYYWTAEAHSMNWSQFSISPSGTIHNHHPDRGIDKFAVCRGD